MSESTDRAKQAVEQEIAKVKQTAEETRDAFRASVEYVAGPPADTPDDARDQLASIRSGLERDIATLSARVPDKDQMAERARPVAIAAGAGLSVVAVGGLVLSRRRAQRRQAETIRAQAAALARELGRVQQAAEDLPGPSDERRRGRGRLVILLLALAGAGVAVWQRSRQQPDPDDPDRWGPPPVPPAAAVPATVPPPVPASETTPPVPASETPPDARDDDGSRPWTGSSEA